MALANLTTSRSGSPSDRSTGSVVCTPLMPPHADQMSAVSFMLGGHGEWSEAMKSSVPSSTARHRSSRIAFERSGGAHLATLPSAARSASSRLR